VEDDGDVALELALADVDPPLVDADEPHAATVPTM